MRPVILLEVAVLAVFWAWVFSACLFLRNTYLPRLPVAAVPAHLGFPVEPVQFQATDGVRLEGWTVARDPAQPWIIGCHGLGANRADLIDIMRALSDAGFNLLLFDFRGHGASAGRASSFGCREQRDLEGALAFLGEQSEIPARPYGVYGISMGAAVALMVASRDERIAAVAADSPYADLQEALERHLRLLYPALPRTPFLQFVLATYRLRFGVWPRQVSPEAALKAFRRPLLLIQGAEDPRMPRSGAERLRAAAAGSELWMVEGAGHLESYALQPQAYRDRLVRFFTLTLRPEPPH